jgi:type IV pilus assembly protein PilM
MMKKYLRRLLPEKKTFTGVDIGTEEIKAAEIRITDGYPEVTALRRQPSPPGVWSDNFDEESLVRCLKDLCLPSGREVITCIGGEKAVSRVVKLPRLSEKELRSAVRFEIEKFVPTPVDQLAIRCIRLGMPADLTTNKQAGVSRNDEGAPKTEDLLILAAPLTTVYRYHGIFSRAGLTVTAVDLQAFALWRVFGRDSQGTAALADIGAKTSHFVLLRDGLIRFIRHLPAGSENISECITELKRSLDYYTRHEDVSAEKVVFSGRLVNFRELNDGLQLNPGIGAEAGIPAVDFTAGLTYDPAFAVSIGLALREVSDHVIV